MNNDNVPADWQALMQTYGEKIDVARAMGGEEKLAKREQAGLLNARQMLDLLIDKDSFFEIGSLAGGVSYQGLKTAAADALVGGIATIDGHKCVVMAEDFTSMGGSIGHATSAKRVRLAKLALLHKIPYISLLDGSGERSSNGLERYPYAPNDLQVLVELKQQVPSVALVFGSSAGHGALTALMADVIIMTDSACLFSAGPPLVAMALGEQVSKEELGGADIHLRHSGVAHLRASDAQQAKWQICQYLALNHSKTLPLSESVSSLAERDPQQIFNLVPADASQAYDMRKVINWLADDESVLELQSEYAQSMSTGFLRIGGRAIAYVANQPAVMAGAITAEGANKAAAFLDLCQQRGLAVLFLADNPGLMSGSAAEKAGTLRAAANMYKAQAALSHGKYHLTLRKAFGFGSSLMAMNPFDNQCLTLAFPGISLGGIPALSGAQAANLDKDQTQLLLEAEQSGAWKAGDNMAFDEVINPAELRVKLLQVMR